LDHDAAYARMLRGRQDRVTVCDKFASLPLSSSHGASGGAAVAIGAVVAVCVARKRVKREERGDRNATMRNMMVEERGYGEQCQRRWDRLQ
jgi:hypothetical protein